MNRTLRKTIVATLASLAATPVPAQPVIKTDEHALRVVVLVRALEYPWSVAWLPDGRMLATERPGRLRVVAKDFRIEREPVAGLPPIQAQGQGGLFDVVPHPRFAENKLVYFAYAAKGTDGVGTELARGRLIGDRLENVQALFRQEPKGSSGRHFGGRVVFDRAGYLYLTLGDRGEMERAQRLDDHAGALSGEMLVRLKLDGKKVVKEERMLKGVLGRIRDVRVGPNGYVYLLTDSPNGVLARLEPVG